MKNDTNLFPEKNNVTSIELYRLRRRFLSANKNFTSLKEKIREMMALLDHQVVSLSSVVESLVDISQIKTKKINLEITDFSMVDLFDEVKHTLQSQFSLSTYPSPIVLLEGDLYGAWDRARIIQVLVNLMVISIKEGSHLPIELHVLGMPEKIRVSISDRGIGISKEEQDKLVNRFEKASTLSEISTFAIGLFIAKKIIQAHGGMIWQHSSIEAGSTIAFEIPRFTHLH